MLRLNKLISNAGICSRRKADELIENGLVKVNGKTVNQLGIKVNPEDEILVRGKNIRIEKRVYLVLNKPKDCITTTYDPEGRKTVMDFVKDACKERLYPIGRLDRNTTGVLLLTNDGELAQKLAHPSNKIKKIYRVTPERMMSNMEIQKLSKGVMLEDGLAVPDSVELVQNHQLFWLEVTMHSGRNRIVRRMFETIGFEVKQLERIEYAGITNKNLPRGRWRMLTAREVIGLKARG
ncbi:MAG: pseudouridine synthase [Bacteroidetes bacterium RIFCSPLOWO2_02_FULL_36_8]|nr:MAG: pseudouridine synthase [Bacteroidetes bacterium RIFCSPLOWO2_02_FULL_36_8]OFY70414.1 MAG: pseudouridine synthase [Bacteroidetes bacterium RIFCSPLOWO2_12_FULL_37_12]